MAELNSAKLDALLGKMLGDMGAAAVGPLVIIGDRLGLYKALAERGPMTTQGLADETGTTERYVREWCAAQAGSGYIEYHADADTFGLSPEQAAVFANDNSPACMTGGYYGIASMYVDEPKVTRAFKTGEGVGWGDHSECLFCGTEKFFRPGYQANLVSQWLPSLDGVADRLRRGVKVADVGCGHGASTIVMAKAFPKSTFTGFDSHEKSIQCASDSAARAGVTNARFQAASAKHFPGKDYDFVAYFDCLHDMGDPVGGLAHARKSLKPDGTVMIVEPFAHDELEKNFNPVGRMYYSFSTMICTPASISQEVGLALGAQAGPRRLEEVVHQGGFSKFRVATATPFNLIIEAKP